MGMFDTVKKAARKTKLQGELLLVQRELESLQKKSGAELFTVLYDWEQQQLHLKYDDHQREEQPLQQEEEEEEEQEEEQEDAVSVSLPVQGLTSVYQAAREDIMDMVEKRQFKVEEVDVVECKLENTVPATTAKAKAQNASQWMSNTGSMAKLKAEIVHLEREINIRKEIFGVQVFNEIDFYGDNESSCTLKEQLEAYHQQQQQQQAKTNNNVNGSSANKLQEQDNESESLSPTAVKVAKPPPRRTDDDIFALLHRIKLAMDPIMERKLAKQQEIASLLL